MTTCKEKSCGDDGCGGSCGTCPADWKCQAGQCVGSSCQPECSGKTCGPDGCGEVCGQCSAGTTCASGKCVQCTPNCLERQCGSDACGGYCGTCPSGIGCKDGQCLGPCTSSCTNKTCGDDGCGGHCGTCSAGTICQAYTCVVGCSSHAAQTCQLGERAWVDSCGTTEEVIEACLYGCAGDQCALSPPDGDTSASGGKMDAGLAGLPSADEGDCSASGQPAPRSVLLILSCLLLLAWARRRGARG